MAGMSVLLERPLAVRDHSTWQWTRSARGQRPLNGLHDPSTRACHNMHKCCNSPTSAYRIDVMARHWERGAVKGDSLKESTDGIRAHTAKPAMLTMSKKKPSSTAPNGLGLTRGD